MTDFDVIVIGAGIAGVAAAKNLLADGHRVLVIEATDHVAGLWQFTEEGYGVTSFTHINVSRHNYCFSDYPFPENTPDYPGHVDMARYVNDYVDHFGVRKAIMFNTKVTKIDRDQDGSWTVSAIKVGTEEVSFKAKAVGIATGHHSIPVFPDFAKESVFKGEIYHSVKFKDAERNRLKGKRLLVVGIGNSGVDIVTHGANHCTHVTLSTRSGAWVLPNYILGFPADFYASRALLSLPWRIGSTIMESIVSVVVGHPNKYNLNPKFRAFQTQPTVSPTLYHTIQRGYVDVKPNIKEFHENGVIFEDGTKADYDVVVYSTGYRIDLPFLTPEIKDKVLLESKNEIKLFKNVFSPQIGESLAFLGFVQPFSGGILSMAETQARWFSQILLGKVRLPSQKTMYSEIEKDQKKIYDRFSNRGRHTIQQDPILYTDEIASFIGAKPSILRHPHLLFPLLFGSGGTYQYRLQGPGKWTQASTWVRKVPIPSVIKGTIYALVLVTLLVLVKVLAKVRARRALAL